MNRGVLLVLALCLFGISGFYSASAATYNSTNFSINGNLGDSIAGGQSSTNYKLISSGGDSIAGSGSSKSYKLGQGYVPTLENSIQVNVQPYGLSAYYAFDEGTGESLFDSSGLNNPAGSFINAPTWTTSGKLGDALVFDGVNDYATIPSDANNNLDTFTITAWVSTTTPYAAGTIIGKGNGSGATPYRLEMDATGKIKCTVDNGTTTQSVTSNNAIPGDNTYTFIACSRELNGDLKIYRSLVTPDATDTNGIGSATNSSSVGIGANADGSSPFKGRIDQVKIFSHVMNDEDLFFDKQAGVNSIESGAWYFDLVPGVSQTKSFDSIVQTSSSGYTLSISHDADLYDGVNYIPPVSGSIASPSPWVEGTTTGFGFSLYDTNATAIPGKWSSGSNYAAMTDTPTSFYTRTGFTGGTKDVINMQYRLDIPGDQPVGDYVNFVTITGTMTP